MPGHVRPEAVQQGRFDSPFFRSKFRVPARPRHFVRRTRLLELLDDLSTYPVTAVVAPAGAGKTALVADWVQGRGTPFAWLALDDGDRDPAQLCTALIAAAESLAPGATDPAIAVVGTPAAAEGAIRLLAEQLELAETEDAVLVIDDVHRIDASDAARAVLETFVEHTPEWLHAVLLSRRRPPVAVDRLRAGGRLADISFDALRFSRSEDLELLAALCPRTPPEDLSAIAQWSGGWAAAIQLAALAVRSQQGVRSTYPLRSP
jgi:LuxR family maltose regulon positive regulatory protein